MKIISAGFYQIQHGNHFSWFLSDSTWKSLQLVFISFSMEIFNYQFEISEDGKRIMGL